MTTPARKRLPAFGRQLAESIRAGREPDDIAIRLDHWPPDRLTAIPSLVVPCDQDPDALDWTLIAGRDAVIPRADEADIDRLRALVAAITASRPRRLWLTLTRPPYVEWIVSAGGAK